jgi:DNA repair exonuclease SbcCD ATPase subunit
MCDITKEECRKYLESCENKLITVKKAETAMLGRIAILNDELVILSNDSKTTREQFKELEEIIDRYERLHARLANMRYAIEVDIRHTTEIRKYCRFSNCKR